MSRRRRGPAMKRRKKSGGKAHRALPQTQDRVPSEMRVYKGAPFNPAAEPDQGEGTDRGD